MTNRLYILFLLCLPGSLSAQRLQDSISATLEDLAQLELRRQWLSEKLEVLRLQKIRADWRAIGLPTNNYIEHTAYFLEYDEAHEQARWVAHTILPQIREGNVRRTNDFRPDPKVATGSAVEADYFLKSLRPDSTWVYDGYGFDRGHLAPSADFRWSAKALSESYFYSNMSPQRPEFNREGWADLEVFLRGYVLTHNVPLYVVTGPLLRSDLPKQQRSPNGLSIPERFFKVALDLENRQAIGFVMPNQKLTYPLESFAVPVDAVEQMARIDLFRALPREMQEKVEKQLDKEHWFSTLAAGEGEPIYAPSLGKNRFNTIQASRYADKGETIAVCGKVVSVRESRSGNLWMNLDKKFPDQVFSVYIRQDDLSNFSYVPRKELINRNVCFEGQVSLLNGTPTMRVEKEERVDFLE